MKFYHAVLEQGGVYAEMPSKCRGVVISTLERDDVREHLDYIRIHYPRAFGSCVRVLLSGLCPDIKIRNKQKSVADG